MLPLTCEEVYGCDLFDFGGCAGSLAFCAGATLCFSFLTINLVVLTTGYGVPIATRGATKSSFFSLSSLESATVLGT